MDRDDLKQLRVLYRKRVARRRAGQVGVLGGAVVIGSVFGSEKTIAVLPFLWLAIWPLMAVVYGVSGWIQPRWPGDEPEDQVRDLAFGSLIWPMWAVALLLPTTLHIPLAGWLLPSMQMVAWYILFINGAMILAYLVLAQSIVRYARLASGPFDRIGLGREVGEEAYMLTIFASALPGMLLLFIPTLVVALTGWFIPGLFKKMHAQLEGENETLDALRQRRIGVPAVNSVKEALHRGTNRDLRTLLTSALAAKERIDVLDLAHCLERSSSVGRLAVQHLWRHGRAGQGAIADRIERMSPCLRSIAIQVFEGASELRVLDAVTRVAQGEFGDNWPTRRRARRIQRDLQQRLNKRGRPGQLSFPQMPAEEGRLGFSSRAG